MSSAGKPGMLWAAAALLAVAVRCAFVEFPVERADELTMARFKAEYADKLRPVVIRGNDRTRAEAALWSAGDFRDRCGAGEITRYVSDASSSAWGGFDMRGERRVPLASFFGEVERSNRSRDIYGFDYNLKCDCEAFVEQTTILPYFKQDAWPVLIAGMPGTRSQLHVDNSFLPFWLTLLAGRKIFRAVERGHWSPALVDRGVVDRAGQESEIPNFKGSYLGRFLLVVDDDGDAEFALDWYDDAAVLDAVGGADVYSSVLEPGDSVYIPVAALHGGSNVGDAPALAITGNYHDEAHHAILVDVYCEGKVRRLMRQSKKLTRIKAMVKDPSCLFWAGALGDVEPTTDRGPVDAPAPLADVVYPDPWFCRSYGPRAWRRGCNVTRTRCPLEEEGDDDDDDDESDFVVDENRDGVLSRQELSLKFAQVSPRYLEGVPDARLTWGLLARWVAAEVEAIWPAGAARPTAAAIDAAIFARFFFEDGTERPVGDFNPGEL
ncbi:hypothetical protein AURANDRAFT_62191 [Aureococcus anophagefferens]|uniref:JmjC domain-containing protein n=1 Tax=Aureococcus anophagefferens TaxID=44056 RepID=F0Y2P3_AURAN|nr:hypothetical protein AURANDRAFT_62191 [Aureococcus anophagefferens]EGB10735.1 hypothetical protein AURANDRAFT_62191 [Aureococcus anophagefferens]|eukprot:XP_009034324.1 hypothetical protein AURANDRAFT_62191 [Aureococcus anophagefferens]